MINYRQLLIKSSFLFISCILHPPASTQVPAYKIMVNSSQDTEVTPDEQITFREALHLVNGQISFEQLSEGEQRQVKVNSEQDHSLIEFNLPPEEATIFLEKALPSIISNGVVIDGSTNPGYVPNVSGTSELSIPKPIVSLTPQEGREVPRGLTIFADDVTVRGLSLYGFQRINNQEIDLVSTADILISDSFPLSQEKSAAPRQVLLEDNWLGIAPEPTITTTSSTFGVFVFNGIDTVIKGNYIANHNGSGIITGQRAENLTIKDNILVGNGQKGISNAIHLEGVIEQTTINSNLICGNHGSAIYLFKTNGVTRITNNQIQDNGQRVHQAAIYLMGSGHEVFNNNITEQKGPGVVVAAYPESDRNFILGNRFSGLDGLSIDLVTRRHVGVQDFQVGDGINPPRNSKNRRLDTANKAINSPQFLSDKFYLIESKVSLDGIADPNAQITLYQVTEPGSNYGPLNQILGEIEADAEGKFAVTFDNLEPGTIISAIANLPETGTSEPAKNVLISELNQESPPLYLKNTPKIRPPCNEIMDRLNH